MASYCSNCGSIVSSSARFCSDCGATVTSSAHTPPIPAGGVTPAVFTGPAIVHNSLACPNCYQTDQVQKVSSVIGAETSLGTLAGPTGGVGYTFGRHGGIIAIGGYTRLTGGSQTLLGKRLSPPSPPDYRFRGGCSCLLGSILAAVAIAFAGALISERIYGSQPTYTVNNTMTPAGAVIAGGLGVALVVFVALIARILVLWVSGRKRTAQSIPHWQRAIGVWDQLYYCHRCDGVYVPGQSPLVPAGDMPRFLYEHVTSP